MEWGSQHGGTLRVLRAALGYPYVPRLAEIGGKMVRSLNEKKCQAMADTENESSEYKTSQTSGANGVRRCEQPKDKAH